MVKGREYVIPEDIKSLAVPAFAHRLVMGGGSRSSADSIDLMNMILDSTEVPTEDWSR
jgi:MoxR-like ATPase